MSSTRTAPAGHPAAWRPLHQGAVWALVWALLLAPTLGRWHEALHGSGSAHAMRMAAAAPAQGDAASAQASGTFLERLFSGHARSDCVLLDQASLGYALPSTGLALPEAAPQACALPTPPERVVGRHVALFHARGPPALRA